MDGNCDRRRDETLLVRFVVQLQRALLIAFGRDRNDWPQRHFLELSASAGANGHGSAGGVFVCDDRDSVPRAEREIGQKVTRRERGNEEIFRVVARGIAAEETIRTSGHVGLSAHLYMVAAVVGLVLERHAGVCAVPDHVRLVLVAFHPPASRDKEKRGEGKATLSVSCLR